MINKFNLLPWHDAELLGINIDRSDPGNMDKVTIQLKWPDGEMQDIIFKDCYQLDLNMNFGIISPENIQDAECIHHDVVVAEIVEKWKALGVALNKLKCFRIKTNSTNSLINIYANSYVLSR